jgi:hypothetical protein
MIEIQPFKKKHLHMLNLQPAQERFFLYFDFEYAEVLETAGPSFSAVRGESVLASAGLIKQWDNRAIAWGLIGAELGNDFIKVHRAVDRFLNMSDFNRIEAYVDTTFGQGHRWIKKLGFEYEGTMRQFNPDGSDACLYARLKNG